MDREIGSGMVNGRVNCGPAIDVARFSQVQTALVAERERDREILAHALHVSRLWLTGSWLTRLRYHPSYRALKANFADLVFFRGCNFNPIYKFFERALFFYGSLMVSRGNILILFDNDDSFGRGKAILYAFLNTEIKTANNLSFLNECWWWNYRLYEVRLL